MKILANDGLSKAGITKLEKAGFTVITQKVEQANLVEEINKQNMAMFENAMKMFRPFGAGQDKDGK